MSYSEPRGLRRLLLSIKFNKALIVRRRIDTAMSMGHDADLDAIPERQHAQLFKLLTALDAHIVLRDSWPDDASRPDTTPKGSW